MLVPLNPFGPLRPDVRAWSLRRERVRAVRSVCGDAAKAEARKGSTVLYFLIVAWFGVRTADSVRVEQPTNIMKGRQGRCKTGRPIQPLHKKLADTAGRVDEPGSSRRGPIMSSRSVSMAKASA